MIYDSVLFYSGHPRIKSPDLTQKEQQPPPPPYWHLLRPGAEDIGKVLVIRTAAVRDGNKDIRGQKGLKEATGCRVDARRACAKAEHGWGNKSVGGTQDLCEDIGDGGRKGRQGPQNPPPRLSFILKAKES